MKHCEKCNLDFPEHFRFCGWCGGGLTDIRKCPSCGEQTESKWPFCTSCGSQLSSDAPKTPAVNASGVPPAEVASTPTRELERRRHPREGPSPDTTGRYSEPGELYGADLSQQITSSRSREITDEVVSPVDDSETVEAVRNIATVPAYRSDTVSTVRHQESSRQPATVDASSVREVKAAPTLSVMESYGHASDVPSQFRWWNGALLAL